jgi:hypothetical protein
MPRAVDTKSFIEKAISIHGNRYDYSFVDYVKSSIKVKIICKKHGVFFQRPNSHLAGKNCPKCVKENRKTKDYFKKANLVHKNKYDYSQSKYMGAMEKIEIRCPIHGVFSQRAKEHLKGYGCPECGVLKSAQNKIKKHSNFFIAKARKIHGDFYDYSKAKYKGNHKKVLIGCPIHGFFKQKAGNHLSGNGCPKCFLENYNRDTKEIFIKKAQKIHKDNSYDYSKVEYKKSNIKVCIICKKHGEFWQTPNKHLQGEGCPSCSSTTFDPQKSAKLYYLLIKNKGFSALYKIGITNKIKVEYRYQKRDLDKIKVLQTWDYPLGIDARKAEQNILKIYHKYLYKGNPPLASVGVGEIFSKDVLGLAA